jgi:hypothetical protein
MITDTELQSLEEIASKEPLVGKLLDAYKEFANSPYYDTYITLFAQISDWNDQLKIAEHPETVSVTENGITVEKSVLKGKIDLFADKDSKEFDRAFKYFAEVVLLLDAMDKIRDRLNPKEKVDAEKAKKINKSNAVAI